MDITPLFKACVKTVRTRNKAFGLQNDTDKSRILRKKPKNGFIVKAKDIISQITRLRDFLLENRGAYMNFSNFLSSSNQMTDAERDQIDNGSQRIINSCSHIIQEFKKETRCLKGSPQTVEFMDAVLKLIEGYLKAVCVIQVEQKAIRVKRALDMRKISKLEVEAKKDEFESHSDRDILELDDSPVISNNKNMLEAGDEKELKSAVSKQSLDVAAEMDSTAANEDIALSAEEMQIFESENIQLYNELNSLSEEVKQIESKVLHIAELQEVFTEKVLQQDQDIDRIAGTVLGVTENVRDANEQIRQAIQRNAGLRVWVLFFLLVMSFSLLFLDWYNE